MPKNLEAIAAWVHKHRPDLVSYLPMIENNNSISLLLTIGFEAGRQFQKDNEHMPLNRPDLYLP